MATPPRMFEDGGYYHIYNRGNRKLQIFLQDRDYERFLEKVVEYKKKFLVKILAYCLMPNHFHFQLQQLVPDAISKFFSNLCNSHSKYFNIKYETVGSQFQGRFKAKKVNRDEYLIYLSSYIHLNPVDLFNFLGTRLVEQLFNYRWSSLPVYLSGHGDEIVDPKPILDYFAENFSRKDPVKGYKNFVLSNIQTKVNPAISHLTFDE